MQIGVLVSTAKDGQGVPIIITSLKHFIEVICI